MTHDNRLFAEKTRKAKEKYFFPRRLITLRGARARWRWAAQLSFIARWCAKVGEFQSLDFFILGPSNQFPIKPKGINM